MDNDTSTDTKEQDQPISINKSEEKSEAVESKESELEDEKIDLSWMHSYMKQLEEMSTKINKKIQELHSYKCKHKLNDNGSVTFWPTPNCQPSKDKLKTTKISDIINKNIECHSDPNTEIIETQTCSFIEASLQAWSNHYSFKIKPEHIWLLILQGVATHVDKNAEKLRDKYVQHDGKMTLLIDRDNFTVGDKNNDWISVINEFVEQIDKNTVEDTIKLLDINFSSTTLTEYIAGRVAIMDICKHYFQYHMRSTACGFPKVTIDGTKQDWIHLKQKCEKMLNEKVDKSFGVWWGKSLLPLIDRFIAAFDGHIDAVFFNSMIKRGSTGGSGSYTYYTGWFNILFPYIKGRKNEFCEPYSMDQKYVKQGLIDEYDKTWLNGKGNKYTYYPDGLASVPVEWNFIGKQLKLKFVAGFIGYKQDKETLEITPNVGWYIQHQCY